MIVPLPRSRRWLVVEPVATRPESWEPIFPSAHRIVAECVSAEAAESADRLLFGAAMTLDKHFSIRLRRGER